MTARSEKFNNNNLEYCSNGITGIESQEKLKHLINTEAKIIKTTVNDISDSTSYNMTNAVKLKQYSPLNIIECDDGKNDHKSSHSRTDFEIQNYINNKFDVSIEEIEQKTLNIRECLDGENDQKSSHSPLNIIECIDGNYCQIGLLEKMKLYNAFRILNRVMEFISTVYLLITNLKRSRALLDFVKCYKRLLSSIF